MSDHQFSEEIRTRLSTVAQRARNDSGFKEQLGADPVGVLTSAGIPEPDVRLLLSVTANDEEVSGYAPCTGPTCRWTICPGTCFPMTNFW